MSKQRIDFGEKVVLKVASAAPPEPAGPKMGTLEALVAFATFIPRGLYLELLERKYWEPGFNIQEAVAEGIRQRLDAMPDLRRPLPPAYLAQLLKKNKKLQG